MLFRSYRAFIGDEQLWYLCKQDEWQKASANNLALKELAESVLPTWVLSGWCWSSEQSNSNSANNTNFPGGSTNNYDKSNSNIAVPVSALRRGVA